MERIKRARPKHGFRSRAAALAAVTRARARGAYKVTAYQCPICDLWHIGHMPTRNI
jgi:hypothetical protein